MQTPFLFVLGFFKTSCSHYSTLFSGDQTTYSPEVILSRCQNFNSAKRLQASPLDNTLGNLQRLHPPLDTAEQSNTRANLLATSFGFSTRVYPIHTLAVWCICRGNKVGLTSARQRYAKLVIMRRRGHSGACRNFLVD